MLPPSSLGQATACPESEAPQGHGEPVQVNDSVLELPDQVVDVAAAGTDAVAPMPRATVTDNRSAPSLRASRGF
ncbi:hypothetical protein GCM10009718_26990 [Isoptericola halotolerans]